MPLHFIYEYFKIFQRIFDFQQQLWFKNNNNAGRIAIRPYMFLQLIADS